MSSLGSETARYAMGVKCSQEALPQCGLVERDDSSELTCKCDSLDGALMAN